MDTNLRMGGTNSELLRIYEWWGVKEEEKLRLTLRLNSFCFCFAPFGAIAFLFEQPAGRGRYHKHCQSTY